MKVRKRVKAKLKMCLTQIEIKKMEMGEGKRIKKNSEKKSESSR